jgi:bifunctional non-homologous end joining protein LigD
VLSRVHWVRPELVAEVKYLTWTNDNLLCQVVSEGLREDKPAKEVRRSPPSKSTTALSRSSASPLADSSFSRSSTSKNPRLPPHLRPPAQTWLIES